MKKIIEGYPEFGGGGSVIVYDNPPIKRDEGNNIFRNKSLHKLFADIQGKRVRIIIEEIKDPQQ